MAEGNTAGCRWCERSSRLKDGDSEALLMRVELRGKVCTMKVHDGCNSSNGREAPDASGFSQTFSNDERIMGRPATKGGKAAKEALQFVDPFLSDIVDKISDDLNYRQRYTLRIQIIKYKLHGDRRRVQDRQVQADFEYIITTYVEPYESFEIF